MGITQLLLWTLPWMVGAMSISVAFSFSGLENVYNIHSYMGLSYKTINNILSSNVSSFSILWLIASVTTLTMSIQESAFSKIKTYFFIGVCMFCPSGINFTIMLYTLPMALVNYKTEFSKLSKQNKNTVSKIFQPFFNVSAVLVTIRKSYPDFGR